MSVPASGPGLRVGSVAGAPIKIGASWILLAGLLVFTMAPTIREQLPSLGNLAIAVALGYAAILLLSVLLHEVAHALSARHFGQPVHAIVADLWGGHTTFDGRGLGPGASAAIAASGPLTNAVLGLFALWSRHLFEPGVPRLLLYAAAVANLALAVFNILPGLPLDGGQILEAGVWKVTGRRSQGTVVAALVGRIVAVLVVLWFVAVPVLRGEGLGADSLWSLLVAWFLWRGASQSLTRGTVLRRMDGKRLSDLVIAVPLIREQQSVAEAVLRAPGGGIVVDGRDNPLGIFTAETANAVPVDRRDGTSVSAAYQHQAPEWVIDADGEDLTPVVQQMALHSLPVAVIRRQGRIVGALQAGDVQRLLAD